MTFKSELLPAPLGPMIARTSCSRTSNVISESALTPPKASEMLSSFKTTSPMRPAGMLSRSVVGLLNAARASLLRISSSAISELPCHTQTLPAYAIDGSEGRYRIGFWVFRSIVTVLVRLPGRRDTRVGMLVGQHRIAFLLPRLHSHIGTADRLE